MQNTFKIQGGKSLKGSILLGGAKNAGYKQVIATLLSDEETRLLNVTPIGDIKLIFQLIEHLGVQVESLGDFYYVVRPKNLHSHIVSPAFGSASRASLMLAGPLLARFGKAELPLPGGDRIGSSRDIDRHLEGFRALGATVKVEGDTILFHAKKLNGTHYRFSKPTHTGTENLLLAAVLAEGKTVLENCGLEPEIDDLIELLKKMGAKIQRSSRTITIEGVVKLNGAIHKILPDRNQVVTYALAAVLTQGDVIIEDATEEHLTFFLDKFTQAGGRYETGNYGMRFYGEGKIIPTDIETAPHPGFMSDWQPLWTTFMTQAQGTSKMIERLYDNRFQYVEILKEVGANIEFFDPKPQHPEEYYFFNITEKSNKLTGIKIQGPTPLKPINVPVWDTRFGATLLLAALMVNGVSYLANVDHIDRGYFNIESKLKQLGADIERVPDQV